PTPTIVFHGDRDTTVHSNNGDRVVRQSIGGRRTNAKVHRGRVPGGHAYTRTVHSDARDEESSSTGKSTEPDTHGQEAAPPAPTLIRTDRMQRGKCCGSSSS